MDSSVHSDSETKYFKLCFISFSRLVIKKLLNIVSFVCAKHVLCIDFEKQNNTQKMSRLDLQPF